MQELFSIGKKIQQQQFQPAEKEVYIRTRQMKTPELSGIEFNV